MRITRRRRQLARLLDPARHQLEELQHVGRAARACSASAAPGFFASATASRSIASVGSASRFLPLVDDDAEHLPDVLHALEVVAPIAQDVGDPDDAPALQLAQAVADVRAGDAERRGDVLGVQRPVGQEQQRVDLGDRAVDAPARAHLPPVEDELLLDRRQRRVLLFSHFCLNRIY